MKEKRRQQSPAAPSPGTQRIDDETAFAWLRELDTPELMARAHTVRLRLHGRRTHMVHSLNINPTNVCENRCELCAFWRERDNPEAYVMTLDEVRERLVQAREMQLTDLHVVGGVIPELNLEYYTRLFRSAKDILPTVLIQGLTAVEIQYLADREKKPVETVLKALKAAGLDAIPGGGAEILDPKVRGKICSRKIAADTWLAIHEKAHAIGLPTNATMLFGHCETPEDWIRHLRLLRDLQDRTHGFRAFILLPFHPSGTRLDVAGSPSGHTIVRLAALSRLYLDNIPHLRVLANYMDRKLLEVLTFSGVDDVGGTSVEERIARAAGAPENHRFVSVDDMRQMIRRLGLEPVLVNSAYQPVDAIAVPATRVAATPSPAALLARASRRERVSAEEALCLYREATFQELGHAANACRLYDVPENRATYVVDRNLSITNVCESGCRFCAFHVAPGTNGAFALSIDQIVEAARQAETAGATQLMIQGGLNPDLTLEFYESALRRLKAETGLWLHSLSPAEIVYMAKRADLTMPAVLKRLKEAGLDSLPGGGAEILVEDVRQRVSPHKITASQWLAVMRAAHALGLKTTATMVYGLGESPAQRIEHLLRVRDLQDQTGGFTAFIPWSFQPNRTGLELPGQTGVEYLRMVALARIVLDNVRHIQAGWVTEGPDLAQLALGFGADDFGGVLMEERVLRATGVAYSVTEKDVVRLIGATGLTPARRTTLYEILQREP
jgi:dehypoxanthine futalosine cyclase